MEGSDGKHVCMLPHIPSYNAVPPTAGTHPYRLVMRIVRSLRLPWARHHGACAFVRSPARLRAERARVHSAAHPYSIFALAVDSIHATLTLAVLIYVPFQVFIICPNPYDPFILFTDVMSFVHIMSMFAIGYVEEGNKQIVLEMRPIALHYLQTYLLPDLIGALPFQIIQLFKDCRYPSHTIMLILKLFKLPTFVKQSMNLIEQLRISYVKKTVLTVIMKVLLFFHWMTFIHFQVPCFSMHYFTEEDRHKVWLKRFTVVNMEHNSLFQKYTTNLFLVCGLCIGTGYYNPVDEHIMSELILTSSMGLIGLLFLTYAFYALLQLAIYSHYEKSLFNGRFRELKEYMTSKRLPERLQRKIELFVNYKYGGYYFNEEMIMSTINEQIKQEINMYVCKKIVLAVPLFQDMPIAFINAIIFSLTQDLVMPGEVIVQSGKPGTSMYLISSGTVTVISPTGRELAHLRDGSYFGETALLHPGKGRTATVIALEITKIYMLEHKDFQTCLQPYPHLRRRLEENYIRRRFASMRRDSVHQPLPHYPS